MNARRVLGALFVCVGIAAILGTYHLRAQQPAGPRPASEQVAKVSLGEVGLSIPSLTLLGVVVGFGPLA